MKQGMPTAGEMPTVLYGTKAQTNIGSEVHLRAMLIFDCLTQHPQTEKLQPVQPKLNGITQGSVGTLSWHDL